MWDRSAATRCSRTTDSAANDEITAIRPGNASRIARSRSSRASRFSARARNNGTASLVAVRVSTPRMAQRNDGHGSQPRALTSARVRSETPPGSMPGATPVRPRARDLVHAFAPFRSEMVFQLLAKQPGQPRRLPAGGDSEQQVAAPDGCRHVKVAKVGLVLDIDQHAACPRCSRQFPRLGGVETGHEQDGERAELLLAWAFGRQIRIFSNARAGEQIKPALEPFPCLRRRRLLSSSDRARWAA